MRTAACWFLVLMAAAAVPGPALPARGLTGGIPTVEALEGAASAEALELRVQVDGERFSAHEKIQLPVPHDTLELVLLDGTVLDVPVEEYVASDWRWTAVEVALDGKPVEPEFRFLTQTAKGSWRRAEGSTRVGGWVVEVGREVRTVEYRWRGSVYSQEALAAIGFLLPSDSWGGHGQVRVVFHGLDFPTALHLSVKTDGWWRQEGDVITFTDRGDGLTHGQMFWPTKTCDEVIAEEYPNARNRVACSGHLAFGAHADHGLSAYWTEGASHGCYDSTALRRARNWIFARHGRPFKSRDLRRFFGSFGWYKADAGYSDARVSRPEQEAAAFILRLEQRCGRGSEQVEEGRPLPAERERNDPRIEGQ